MSSHTRPTETSNAATTPAASSRARPAVRVLSATLFGAFAALGFALVARPALLDLLSLGLFAPTHPWDVPLGRLFVLLAALLSFETLRLGLAVAAESRLRARARIPLLLLVSTAFVARTFAGEPLPPASEVPTLLSAMRTAADALDRAYPERARYEPDEMLLTTALSAIGRTGFVYRGHELFARARILDNAERAQGIPRRIAGDLPGDIYIAISADRSRAFITALTLDESGAPQILRTPTGRPLVIESRAGTHSAPGRDPLVPEYPGMRSPTAPDARKSH